MNKRLLLAARNSCLTRAYEVNLIFQSVKNFPRRKFLISLAAIILYIIFISLTGEYFWNERVDKKPNAKVLCYILLSKTNIQRAKIIQRTWGRKCDKLLFFGRFHSSEGINVTYLPSREGYPFLWSKSKAALVHLFQEYHDRFEWFFKADDDTFVIVENLKNHLTSFNYEIPLWSGFKLKSSQLRKGYMSGGAGYVYSKAALREVVKLFLSAASSLPLKNTSTANSSICNISGLVGYEDLELGKCFHQIGVEEISSVDFKARHKFLPLPLNTLLNNEVPTLHWLNYQAWNIIKYGKECCSPNLISIHKVSTDEMETLNFLLYATKTFQKEG